MSLINDMLKDLERTRKGKAAGPSLLTGVQAVTGVTRRGVRRPLLAVLILLAGLALGGGLRLLLPAGSPPQPMVSAEVPAPPPAPAAAPAAAPVAVQAQPVVASSEPVPLPTDPAAPITQDVVAAAAPPAVEPQPPDPIPAPAPTPTAAPKVAPTNSQPLVAAVTTEKLEVTVEASPVKAPPAKSVPVVAAKPSPTKAAAPQAIAAAPPPIKTLPTAAALLQEARGLLKNGQNTLAAERLEQALTLEPAAFAPRDLLANLHLQQGRRAAAVELWRAGVKVAPSEVYWRKRLARSLLEDNDGGGAVELLQGGAQPTLAADVEFYGLLAAAFQRQGEPSRASAVYRRLTEQEPRGGIWWLGLAIALEGLRDGDGAKNAYQQALMTEGLGEDARTFASGRLNQLDR